MLKLSGAAITDVGNFRENNEDNYLLFGNYKTDRALAHDECEIVNEIAEADENTVVVGEDDVNDEIVDLVHNSTVVAVFDGVGGADNGEVASLICAEQLSLKDSLVDSSSIKTALLKLNEKVCDEINKSGNVMGATVAALFFYGDNVISANLGDSRCYLFRNGKLCQLSHDHSKAQLLIDRGEMSALDAKNSNKWHIITQYIGITRPEIKPEPYFTGPLLLEKGDRFLVCSDGLTDPLSDNMIKNILLNSDTKNAFMTAGELVDAALKAGGRDNVTAVLVDVN
ncbi:MAG: serine/threonine-protein phosphatase [Butyrivibrio sp.]|nr:serine/threonine-protein phosphatase [Butyrivibrio sp.]